MDDFNFGQSQGICSTLLLVLILSYVNCFLALASYDSGTNLVI